MEPTRFGPRSTQGKIERGGRSSPQRFCVALEGLREKIDNRLSHHLIGNLLSAHVVGAIIYLTFDFLHFFLAHVR